VLGDERPDAARVFAGLPPARPDDEGLRESIRALRAAVGLLLGVLDDDPTGSQAVHGVQVVTVLDEDAYAAALAGPAATCFVLTNSRSLDEPEAAGVTARAARGLVTVAGRRGTRIQLISRSDSTLRGHVMAEVAALQAVRRDLVGRGYDGVLLVPAFLEAGRMTAADIHWARTPAGLVPVGETEFAQDSAFGYGASDLRVFVAEKSGGAIQPDEVRSISLADIRLGGPARVREVLASAAGGAWVVVNATEYSDLETVARSVLEAEREGQSFLFRTGPSFVRALSGLGPRPPLRGAQIWGTERGAQIWGTERGAQIWGTERGAQIWGTERGAQIWGRERGAQIRGDTRRGGHGLVVVGSHVGQTSRQVAALRARRVTADMELDVQAVLAGGPDVAAAVARRVAGALARSDVLLYTSRDVVAGRDAADSLMIARTVSAALSRIVRAALAARPAWVIAKGGITSHDVMCHGLGIRRAEVAGQLFPGTVSVFWPLDAAPEAVGMPYVVFAGNVGDDGTLAQVVAILNGEREVP
jgi:uncharacterized protein YgbK (DUF1537 family)